MLHPYYESYYYKSKKAESEGKKNYYRYITYLRPGNFGGIAIHGEAGEKLYLFYNKKQAIARYNQEARNANGWLQAKTAEESAVFTGSQPE